MLFNHHAEVPAEAWHWDNFSPDEPNLACPCCGEFYLDPNAMDRLQAARNLWWFGDRALTPAGLKNR